MKPGSPLETWTSTETARPTAPLSVAEATEASTQVNGRTGSDCDACLARAFPPLGPHIGSKCADPAHGSFRWRREGSDRASLGVDVARLEYHPVGLWKSPLGGNGRSGRALLRHCRRAQLRISHRRRGLGTEVHRPSRGAPARRYGGLKTGLRKRRLPREKPVCERVAHLCRAGQAPHPLRTANLTWISVPDISPSQCRHNDMHDNQASEDLWIGLALSHPPSVPPQVRFFAGVLPQFPGSVRSKASEQERYEHLCRVPIRRIGVGEMLGQIPLLDRSRCTRSRPLPEVWRSATASSAPSRCRHPRAGSQSRWDGGPGGRGRCVTSSGSSFCDIGVPQLRPMC